MARVHDLLQSTIDNLSWYWGPIMPVHVIAKTVAASVALGLVIGLGVPVAVGESVALAARSSVKAVQHARSISVIC